MNIRDRFGAMKQNIADASVRLCWTRSKVLLRINVAWTCQSLVDSQYAVYDSAKSFSGESGSLSGSRLPIQPKQLKPIIPLQISLTTSMCGQKESRSDS